MIAKNHRHFLLVAVALLIMPSLTWGSGFALFEHGNRSNDRSNLYMNYGGEFTDIATSAGITERGLGMGVAAFDADNDLDFDLLPTRCMRTVAGSSSTTRPWPRGPTTRGVGGSASMPATWISTVGRTSLSPTASTVPRRRMCSS
jgi:hypothetical protein